MAVCNVCKKDEVEMTDSNLRTCGVFNNQPGGHLYYDIVHFGAKRMGNAQIVR